MSWLKFKQKKMKNILTFLSILIFFNSFSQDKEFLYEIKYELSKEFNKNPDYDILTKKYEPEKIFTKSISKKEIIINSLNIFAENAKITIKKNDNNQIDLILDSKFSSDFVEKTYGLINLKSKKSNLLNPKMEEIRLSESFTNSFGSKYLKDSNTEFEYQTVINQSITLENKEVNLRGSVFYEISVLTDYSKLKLNKTNVGNTIELNGLKYELVEIRLNKVILKKLYNNASENNIKLLIFNKKNDLIVADKNSINSSVSSEECDKNYYEFLSKNKDYTLTEFKKQNKFENIISKNGLYLILSGVANIENDFMLYEPIYGVKKEFEVKINK